MFAKNADYVKIRVSGSYPNFLSSRMFTGDG
jgi:hypothetical protein